VQEEDYESAEKLFKNSDNTELTELGRVLSFFPLAPRFSKLILLGRSKKCLPYSILLAAGLSVEELFNKKIL